MSSLSALGQVFSLTRSTNAADVTNQSPPTETRRGQTMQLESHVWTLHILTMARRTWRLELLGEKKNRFISEKLLYSQWMPKAVCLMIDGVTWRRRFVRWLFADGCEAECAGGSPFLIMKECDRGTCTVLWSGVKGCRGGWPTGAIAGTEWHPEAGEHGAAFSWAWWSDSPWLPDLFCRGPVSSGKVARKVHRARRAARCTGLPGKSRPVRCLGGDMVPDCRRLTSLCPRPRVSFLSALWRRRSTWRIAQWLHTGNGKQTSYCKLMHWQLSLLFPHISNFMHRAELWVPLSAPPFSSSVSLHCSVE